LQRSGRDPQTRTRVPSGSSAAFAVWLPQLNIGDAEPAMSAARDRLARRVLQPPSSAGDIDPARLLAVLAPHAGLATTLSRIREDGNISQHADAVDRRLAELGGLLPGDSESWHLAPEPSDPIDSLTALGLFAEWAGAAAFALRDPDLALLARCAERWRRTTAGHWSYDRLAARVEALQAATDPVEASHEQLAAWSGDRYSYAWPLLDEIRYRLPGALKAAGAVAPDIPQAASILARKHVPSAFVPPLAVLLVRGNFY
jgi:hypothetical protein